MNHFYSVLFPTVCVEYSQFQSDWHSTNDPCPFPIYHVCSFCVQKCHKSQPWWIHAAQILSKTARVLWGTLPDTLGGEWSPRTTLTNPSGRSHIGESLSLLLLLPPTSGTDDESYLSILVPGAWRPYLFILICSICGTAVAGRGWCWQRFVHAFPWQRYSWQARQQAEHTWLINTNNEAVNQEVCWKRQKWERE